ncbi:carotenoid biosynthesis protein [Micromonospora sp. AMSO12t]|uniref:carotenoid biosynthesis protein n=1 Tax=unclassified Micromonospora TaxID=2617518 RepID=UPI00124B2905|nr:MULTISPECIES: carotenoid biosynthesis protein [unclassified Micromonospora]KAB1133136.1 carotenoid biosynthesis protein [Micromonospora sp. AMSO12t]WSG01781.1 carotenoid biosynthesis protein [Micromonospora sp. NBC_01740]
MTRRLSWALLAVLVLAQICYPLTTGETRARLTVATVVLGYLLSVGHALLSRGPRTAAALVAVATVGGFAIEALGVATGFPFGSYDYSGELGPKLAGVPLIIPLAWTWMAWPAWLAATRLTGGDASARPGAGDGPSAGDAPGRRGGRFPVRRIALAAVGLAAWDLFLDPQMVAEGYWVWRDATPALPGLPGIPVSNYLGWLLFAVLMMSALRPLAGPAVATTDGRDGPMFALWLWTYFSSVLAHAVFLDLPASALWGAVGMSVAAVPLAVTLIRSRRDDRHGTRQPQRPGVDATA